MRVKIDVDELYPYYILDHKDVEDESEVYEMEESLYQDYLRIKNEFDEIQKEIHNIWRKR